MKESIRSLVVATGLTLALAATACDAGAEKPAAVGSDNTEQDTGSLSGESRLTGEGAERVALATTISTMKRLACTNTIEENGLRIVFTDADILAGYDVFQNTVYFGPKVTESIANQDELNEDEGISSWETQLLHELHHFCHSESEIDEFLGGLGLEIEGMGRLIGSINFNLIFEREDGSKKVYSRFEEAVATGAGVEMSGSPQLESDFYGDLFDKIQDQASKEEADLHYIYELRNLPDPDLEAAILEITGAQAIDRDTLSTFIDLFGLDSPNY